MDNTQRVGLMVGGCTMILASGDPFGWTWSGLIGFVMFMIGFYYEGRKE